MDWDFSTIDLTSLPAFGSENLFGLSESNNGIEVVESGSYRSSQQNSGLISSDTYKEIDRPEANESTSSGEKKYDEIIGLTSKKRTSKKKSKDKIIGSKKTKHSINTNRSKVSAISSIDSTRDQDWYKIKLSAGYSYEFSVTGGRGSQLKDSYLTIYNSKGRKIAYDDNSGKGKHALLSYSTSKTGNFYLGIQGGKKANSVGSYKITSTKSELDTIAGNKRTKSSINTNKAKASVSSSIDVAKDQDWFKAKLTSGYNYKFDVTGGNGSQLKDSYLTIYNSQGKQVAYDDNSGRGKHALLSYSTNKPPIFISAFKVEKCQQHRQL